MATNVLLAIQERMADLSGAERHVATFVLAHPERVLTMSTKALATAAGASPATVVRFSRRLGATGFADLKLQLSAEHHTDPALLEEITPDEDLEMMKDKLTLRVRQTLQDTNRSLTAEALEKAVMPCKPPKASVFTGWAPLCWQRRISSKSFLGWAARHFSPVIPTKPLPTSRISTCPGWCCSCPTAAKTRICWPSPKRSRRT